MGLTGEVQVRLSGDNSQYKNMLSDSTKETDGFATKVSGKVADKLFGLRDISTAIATALGLNFEAIAEKVARVITGISKAEEEGYKQMAQLSDQATELSLRNMRAKLTEEQKYQLALQERDSLQRKVDAGASEGGADQARLAKLNLELQQKNSEVIAIELKQRDELAKKEVERIKAFDESVKRRIDAGEKQLKADMDLLSGDEKLAAMAENIDALQAHITEEKIRGKDVTQLEAILAERTRDFDKEAQQQAKEANDEEEKAIKRQGDLEDRLAKAKFEALTTAEQITKLEQSRDALVSNIADAEKDSEESLEMQADLAEVNNKLTALRAERAREVLSAEENITAEAKKQAEAAAEELKKRTMTVTQKYGTADKDLSDRELAEKAGNLQRQLTAARVANDDGQFFFEKKLNEVKSEIGYRAAFRTDYAKKGESALLNFSAFDEQRLKNYVRPEDEKRAQQQADAIQDIRDRLSGVKPMFGIGG